MGVVQMGYYRASCDEPDCKTQINVASEQGKVYAILQTHKWWVDKTSNPLKVKCPAHDPEEK